MESLYPYSSSTVEFLLLGYSSNTRAKVVQRKSTQGFILSDEKIIFHKKYLKHLVEEKKQYFIKKSDLKFFSNLFTKYQPNFKR